MSRSHYSRRWTEAELATNAAWRRNAISHWLKQHLTDLAAGLLKISTAERLIMELIDGSVAADRAHRNALKHTPGGVRAGRAATAAAVAAGRTPAMAKRHEKAWQQSDELKGSGGGAFKTAVAYVAHKMNCTPRHARTLLARGR